MVFQKFVKVQKFLKTLSEINQRNLLVTNTLHRVMTAVWGKNPVYSSSIAAPSAFRHTILEPLCFYHAFPSGR